MPNNNEDQRGQRGRGPRDLDTNMKAWSEELWEWWHGQRGLSVERAFALARSLYEALTEAGHTGEARKKWAEELVWGFLSRVAEPFCCYGIGYLLPRFDSDIFAVGVPIEVSQDDHLFSLLLAQLGCRPGSPMKERLGKYVGMMCKAYGTKTETRLSFHYEPKAFTAYLAARPGVLIRLDRHGFEEVPNGADGQLFMFPENWRPLLTRPLDEAGHDMLAPTVVEKDKDGSIARVTGDFPKSDRVRRALFPDGFLASHLFKDVHFDVRGLSEKQLRVLLLAYLLFLMLPGAVSERVLLECLGESGSGKTFFASLLGLVLLGEGFRAQPLPGDKKEFENQVINSYYIVYDNVSHVPREVRDLICQAVTGLSVVRRVLYTDKDELRVPSKATLALSAINPPLPELEHQNRSITVRFNPRPQGTYVSQIELEGQVLANRDEIVLNLLYRLSLAVAALEAQRGYVPKVNNRLASVATFILRIAKHEGWEEDAKRLLDAWSGDQVAESLDEDDVSEAIARWMSRPKWEPEWLTATGLNEALVAAMAPETLDPVLKSTRIRNLSWDSDALKLAKRLGANLKVYAARFGLEREKSRFQHSRGTWSYRFSPSASQLQEARQLARGVLQGEMAF